MKYYDYERTIKLLHEEVPAKLNKETGEFIILENLVNNIPENKKLFGKKEVGWRKSFDYSWEFLDEVLTDLELRVTQKLCRMAKMNTNSLEPLNDNTTQIMIAQEFNIDHRKSKKIFDKLYNLGIYAKFDIAKVDVSYTKYWILNPYLSFGGKLVESDIANLFIGTQLTNEYYKRASQIAKKFR